MHFKLLKNTVGSIVWMASHGHSKTASDYIVFSAGPTYTLHLGGMDVYAVTLYRPDPGSEITIPNVGGQDIKLQVSMSESRVGPTFWTKIKSAAIIAACRIMHRLRPVDYEDHEAILKEIQAFADHMGGYVKLSEALGPDAEPPEEDFDLCMLDTHLERLCKQPIITTE